MSQGGTNFHGVVMGGSLNSLLDSLKRENKTIKDVLNDTDEYGISLLEDAIAWRSFDIANYLLDAGAKVNVVSKMKCNEFHYLAAHINCDEGLKIANRLLELGVDLNLTDKKYGNSAIFTLFHEIARKMLPAQVEFFIRCLKKGPRLDDANKGGITLRQAIEGRGTDEMKRIAEGL